MKYILGILGFIWLGISLALLAVNFVSDSPALQTYGLTILIGSVLLIILSVWLQHRAEKKYYKDLFEPTNKDGNNGH